MPEPSWKEIRKALWPTSLRSGQKVWTILDGARTETIYRLVTSTYLERSCLFAGDLAWQLQMTAPYLVQLEPDDKLLRIVLQEGWGLGWGIFLHSREPMRELRRHFRTFLRVRDEQGNYLLFRYYDPRVLRAYLPTCWPEELRTVFGPVDSFLLESENESEMLDFRFDDGRLLINRISLLLELPVDADGG